LLPLAFEHFEEVLRKMDQYSTASARMLYAEGVPDALQGVVSRFLDFFSDYVLRAGFP